MNVRVINAPSKLDPSKQNRVVVTDEQMSAARRAMRRRLITSGIDPEGAEVEGALIDLIVDNLPQLLEQLVRETAGDERNAALAAVEESHAADVEADVAEIRAAFASTGEPPGAGT